MHGDILVGTIDTIGITIADPSLGNALSAAPVLVGGAGELAIRIAFTRVALVSSILVRIIEAIIITIADVNPWYAVAIVAGEKITETCSLLRLAIVLGFVGLVTAIIIAVAVPGGRYASMIGTTETVWWAGSLRADDRRLVRLVTTIIVAIYKQTQVSVSESFP